MWIETLDVQGVGPFAEPAAFRFEPGANLVSGGNERGKTSLATAVFAAFFGLEPGSRLLADSGPAQVAVTFHVGERTLSLSRDLRSGRVRLAGTGTEPEAELFAGTPEDEAARAAYRECLESILGPVNGPIWSRSGFVRDGRLATGLDREVLEWLPRNPHGAYEAMLAEVDRDLEAASGTAPSGGNGNQAAEVSDQRARLRGWRRDAIRLREAIEEAETLEASLSENSSRIGELEETLQNLTRFEGLTRERDRLENSLIEVRDERDRIRKHVEIQEQSKARLQHEFVDFLNGPSEIEDTVQFYIDSSHRLQSVERDLEAAKRLISELPVLHTARNGAAAAAVLGTLAWLICAGSGAAHLGLLLFPVFAAAGLLVVWYLDRNAGRVRIGHEAEKERILNEYQKAREVYDDARRNLGSLAKYDSPAELRTRLRGYLELQEKLERAREVTSSLRPLGEVADAYEEVFSELQVLDTQTRDLVAQARYLVGLDASQSRMMNRIEEVRRDTEQSGSRTQEIENRLLALKQEIAALEGRIGNPGRLTEDLRQLAVQDGPGPDAIALARDALRDAVAAHEERHLDRLAARASHLFARLSGGRHTAVRFGDGQDPEIRSDGAWAPVGTLSRMAGEQFHFVVRLALSVDPRADLAFPLVLDEPFPGWDKPRLDAAWEALADLADLGHQVILLTADSRLCERSGSLLRLDDGASDSSATTRRVA